MSRHTSTATLAAAYRSIAEALAVLGDQPIAPTYITVGLQVPDRRGGPGVPDAERRATVDLLTAALAPAGVHAIDGVLGDEWWYRVGDAGRADMSLSIYAPRITPAVPPAAGDGRAAVAWAAADLGLPTPAGVGVVGGNLMIELATWTHLDAWGTTLGLHLPALPAAGHPVTGRWGDWWVTLTTTADPYAPAGDTPDDQTTVDGLPVDAPAPFALTAAGKQLVAADTQAVQQAQQRQVDARARQGQIERWLDRHTGHAVEGTGYRWDRLVAIDYAEALRDDFNRVAEGHVYRSYLDGAPAVWRVYIPSGYGAGAGIAIRELPRGHNGRGARDLGTYATLADARAALAAHRQLVGGVDPFTPLDPADPLPRRTPAAALAGDPVPDLDPHARLAAGLLEESAGDTDTVMEMIP